MRTVLVSSLAVLCLIFATPSSAQEVDESSFYNRLFKSPERFFGAIEKKAASFEQDLQRSTEKYLKKLKRRELRLKRELHRKDSAAAEFIFGNIDERYSSLEARLKDSLPRSVYQKVYDGHLDSISTAILFIKTESSSLNAEVMENIDGVLTQHKKIQSKLDQVNSIEKLLVKRQNDLKTSLLNTGLLRQYRKMQQDVYYYREKIDAYRKLWQNPSELEAKLLGFVQKVPAFQNFFANNSLIGQLFPVAQTQGTGNLSVPGLQVRDVVTAEMVNRFGSQQNLIQQAGAGMNAAQSAIANLKEKASRLGNSGAEMEMPDFKPAMQKSKSFLKRLELGTNFQTTKGNSFYPVTTDLGFSLGYKINDRSVAGIGASYKLGLGQNFRNIRLSHEGFGLRSFVDVKIKGSFFASGGFEYNYQLPFESLRALNSAENWKRSGIVGFSKIIAAKGNFFKGAGVQIMWDLFRYNEGFVQSCFIRMRYRL